MEQSLYKDWLLTIALGLSCVFIGALFDFVLSKREVSRLHATFVRWAEVLRSTPLKSWQITIAKRGIAFLENLHDQTYNVIRRYLALLVMGAIVMLVFMLYGPWLVSSVFLPFIIIGIYRLLTYLEVKFKVIKIKDRVTQSLLVVPVLSVMLSLLALLAAIFWIPGDLLNSHWFQLVDGWIIPLFPIQLPILNLPFDVATALLTFFLLKWVVRKGRFIGVIAILDIASSAVLTFMLYAVLRLIEGAGTLEDLAVFVLELVEWFKLASLQLLRVLTGNLQAPGGKVVRDLHLMPILLTTFVPVTAYMGVFIALSFVKLVMQVAARIFGIVGEREESVFRQFGFLLASAIWALKAISDYLTFQLQ